MQWWSNPNSNTFDRYHVRFHFYLLCCCHRSRLRSACPSLTSHDLSIWSSRAPAWCGRSSRKTYDTSASRNFPCPSLSWCRLSKQSSELHLWSHLIISAWRVKNNSGEDRKQLFWTSSVCEQVGTTNIVWNRGKKTTTKNLTETVRRQPRRATPWISGRWPAQCLTCSRQRV